jgi:hypothetical protein
MNFNKFINIFTVLTFILVVLMPTADAWSWKTHSEIVDVVYYGLPTNVQEKLDLKTMENASNDPDEIFHDFTYHSYPKSYDKAVYWLDLGKNAYYSGNYENASYDYGVACHYISDTFSAPHGVSGESSSLHSKYEDHAKKLTPTLTSVNGDLNTLMMNGKNQDASSWSEWLQTDDDSIIQNNLDQGTSVCLFAVNNSINNGTGSVATHQSLSFVDYIINGIKSLF